MKLLKYSEDRIPVLILFTYFALDLVVYLTARSWWVPLLWFGIGIIPKGWISAWNHHQQHVPMFRHNVMNRVFEMGLGLQTGVVGNAWVLHHVLGHHLNYLDQTKDESRWKTLDGRVMGELEYTFVTTWTAYPRLVKVGLRHRKHLWPFLYMAALTVGALALLFTHNWYNALFVYLLPMLVSFHLVVWATWFHHRDRDTQDVFAASNNILDPWYNIATGNLGYHTAHHYRQALHWSKLPTLHAEISDKIPLYCYQDPGAPFTWIRAWRKRRG
jgi:fatty acid desaturase